jgi:hypothetical protein
LYLHLSAIAGTGEFSHCAVTLRQRCRSACELYKFDPLPDLTYLALRRLVAQTSQSLLVIPNAVGPPERICGATTHMDRGGAQAAMKAVVEQCGLEGKRRFLVHRSQHIGGPADIRTLCVLWITALCFHFSRRERQGRQEVAYGGMCGCLKKLNGGRCPSGFRQPSQWLWWPCCFGSTSCPARFWM